MDPDEEEDEDDEEGMGSSSKKEEDDDPVMRKSIKILSRLIKKNMLVLFLQPSIIFCRGQGPG